MSNVPAELLYTSDHEWVSALTDEGTVRIGITDHAQDALGDVVYVDLPSEGDTVEANDSFGEIESTKSVSDVLAPVAGEVVAVNEAVNDDSSLVNSDPYGRAGSLSCALQTLMISLVCSLLRHTKQSWTRVSTMV